jgi:hypothetical protein
MTGPLEKTIETAVVKHAKKRGLLVYKLEKRNAPDRLFILPSGYCFFIEFKRFGQKPRPGQEHEFQRLRNSGRAVYVVDETAVGIELIESELNMDRLRQLRERVAF